MHDPMIVAHEIHSPLPWGRCRFTGRLHFPVLATIWHVDPERGGSDDSCGYSFPRLTPAQCERLKALAWWEAYEPWFQRLRARTNDDPAQAECLMRGAVQSVSDALGLGLAWGDVCRWACRFVHRHDSFRGSLCHLPGYHTNFEADRRDDREDAAFGLFSGIALHLLRDRRPWYRHPRWHLHHWRIQVPLLQTLWRWLFERCSVCGKGYPWGYCPIGDWDGTKTWHHECDPAATRPADPMPVRPPWTVDADPHDLPTFRAALERRNKAHEEYEAELAAWRARNEKPKEPKEPK